MQRTGIILAGGSSSRFGKDKGLLELNEKPLIKLIIEKMEPLVEEVIVVTNSHERKQKYARALDSNIQFKIDKYKLRGPLIGTLTGLETAHGRFSLILPFDTPFVSPKVISLLFDLCKNKDAAIPSWPNGQIEPLQAVYSTKTALKSAKAATNEGKLTMRAMISKLARIEYISTLTIKQLDPKLVTFFNINEPKDLAKARNLLWETNQE